MQKSLNTLMAKMELQAVIATSNMQAKIQAFAEARNRAMQDGTIDATEQAELDRLQADIAAEQQRIMEAWRARAQTLNGYGQGAQKPEEATGPAAGSIAALQESLSKLQSDYNNAVTDAERSRLGREIEALEERIKRMQDPSTGLHALPGGISSTS